MLDFCVIQQRQECLEMKMTKNFQPTALYNVVIYNCRLKGIQFCTEQSKKSIWKNGMTKHHPAHLYTHLQLHFVFGHGRRVPKSHSSCSCCYKLSKGFVNTEQRNFAYTFVLTLPTDLSSEIFHLFSN